MSQHLFSPAFYSPCGISYQQNLTTSEMVKEPEEVSMQKSVSQQSREEQRLGLAWRW